MEVILLKFLSLWTHKIKMGTKMKESKVAAKLYNFLKGILPIFPLIFYRVEVTIIKAQKFKREFSS